MARLKLGILISGRGSNLQALARAFAASDARAEIALVVSSTHSAGGLIWARQQGLPCQVVDHRDHADRAAFDAALDERLRAAGVELICLAGFMRLLGDSFVEAWRDRMVNIHPSLLPAFKGRHPQRQAIEAGVRISGCTVHFVRPAMDAGPIIGQAAVPVQADDDETSLASRILEAEHRLYPAVVQLIAEGAIEVRGERVVLAPTARERLSACNGLPH